MKTTTDNMLNKEYCFLSLRNTLFSGSYSTSNISKGHMYVVPSNLKGMKSDFPSVTNAHTVNCIFFSISLLLAIYMFELFI